MTPRLLYALVERRNDQEKQADFRAGMICAAHAGGKPEDYFPHLAPPAPDGDALLRKVELMNARFGGKDLRKRADG